MKSQDEYLDEMRNEPDPHKRANLDRERLRALAGEERKAKAISEQRFVIPGQIISLEAGEYEDMGSVCHVRALVRFGFADMAIKAREAGVSCKELPAWLVSQGIVELMPDDFIVNWWIGLGGGYGVSMPNGHGRDYY